ncbi:NAD(P)-binding domain-containing protein, partial [Vibrio alginolyticus]|nr:NAD(P)-binding domain-containing protein [Vibrio alginolyticus]
GGNTFFQDTIRRNKELSAQGFNFIGTGVSGGEEGALKGPSIMPGGQKEAYELVAPILKQIAAQAEGEPCVTYIGADGAGHYVKMVHNGIEYGDMQLIAEAYSVLKNALGISNDELASVFSEWNNGELSSYLIDITKDIFRKKDEDGNYLV